MRVKAIEVFAHSMLLRRDRESSSGGILGLESGSPAAT